MSSAEYALHLVVVKTSNLIYSDWKHPFALIKQKKRQHTCSGKSLFRQRIKSSWWAKQSGEYRYEWKISVGKLIFKWNIMRSQVCVSEQSELKTGTIRFVANTFHIAHARGEGCTLQERRSWSCEPACAHLFHCVFSPCVMRTERHA